VFYNNIRNTITKKYENIPNKLSHIEGFLMLNSPEAVKSQGIEIDVVGVVTKYLKLFSNYTYIYNLSKDTSGHYGAGVPLAQINGGISYNIPGKHNFRGSLIVKHVNGYLKGLTTKSTTQSFTFVDLNTIFPITENVSIEVQVRNLLNQKVYVSTQTSYSNNYLIPLPGRSFLFTLALNFR
jgi:outer membrane receptor protein involved in Fe transport